MNWPDFVEIDPRYFRPTEVDLLIGDSAKAKEKLGWRPRTTFADLARLMLKADLEAYGLSEKYCL
jgi:GDPmannose 4,6-dehydratase